MPTRSPRKSSDTWRALIEKFSESGLSRREFCKIHHISLSTFDHWRRKLEASERVRNKPVTSDFIEITRPEMHASAQGRSWHLELELGHGVTLRMNFV